MTKEEFVAEYERLSGLKPGTMEEWGSVALPCYCGEDLCQGWAMIGRENVDWHMRHEGVPPDRETPSHD